MANEKLIEKNLKKGVEKLDGWCIKFWPLSLGGFPDRIILIPFSKIFFVELKSTGEQPEPLQKVQINRLRRMGFRVDVIDRQEQLNEYLKFLQSEVTK